MIHLELTDEEQQALTDTLEHDVSDLGMEIAGTDQQDFRDGLKHRRELLNSVLRRLHPDQNAGASPDPSI